MRKQGLAHAGISFAEKYPDLTKEWAYERNPILPNELAPKSNYSAWWKCKFGHEWHATIVNRTHNHSNCPYCTNQTSRLEIFVYCECMKLFKNVKWREKIYNVECDVFLSDNNIAIEIDGEYWHRNKLGRDRLKQNIIIRNNISLFRIREHLLPEISGNIIVYNKSEEYIDIFIRLLRLITKRFPKLIFADYINNRKQLAKSEFNKIVANLPSPPIGNSLLFTSPLQSKEWDYARNYPLRPEMFTKGSMQKVFWICHMKHSWEAVIKNRIARGSNCPVCNNLSRSSRTIKRFVNIIGSLQEKHPELLNEWDWSKNNILGFFPDKMTSGSVAHVWWRCDKGHSWQTQIITRTRHLSGCPYCFHDSQRRP
jgi:hypothetical protein